MGFGSRLLIQTVATAMDSHKVIGPWCWISNILIYIVTREGYANDVTQEGHKMCKLQLDLRGET